MSLKLELTIDKLENKILKWYQNNNKELISHALYHGYVVMNSLDYSKNLEESEQSKIKDLDSYIEELELNKEELENKINSLENKINLLEKNNNNLESNLRLNVQSIVEEKTKYMKITMDTLHQRINDKDEVILNYREESKKYKEELDSLKNIFSNSNKKGSYAEEQINDYLKKECNEQFIIYEPGIDKQDHQGDTHLILKSRLNDNSDYRDCSRIMIESKFYDEKSKYILGKEVQKFYDDIDYCCSHNMPIYSAIFISLDCDIPGITDSYCNKRYRDISVHFIANMNNERWLLLKSIIDLETCIFESNKQNNNNNEKLYNLVYSEFSKLYKDFEKLSRIDPNYDNIINYIKTKVQRDYNREKNKICKSVEAKIDRLKLQIKNYNEYIVDDDEVYSNLIGKKNITQINQEELSLFQQTLTSKRLENERLEEENRELRLQIEESQLLPATATELKNKEKNSKKNKDKNIKDEVSKHICGYEKKRGGICKKTVKNEGDKCNYHNKSSNSLSSNSSI